jgi:hypothetical protein
LFNVPASHAMIFESDAYSVVILNGFDCIFFATLNVTSPLLSCQS